MKTFSLYDRKEPLEQVIKRGEFSGIIFANIHFYKPGETHVVHSHDDHEEIFICFQGRGKVVMNGEEKEFARGDVLVFKPGESHGFKSDNVDALAYLCIGVNLSTEATAED